jgi:hypothetical protein
MCGADVTAAMAVQLPPIEQHTFQIAPHASNYFNLCVYVCLCYKLKSRIMPCHSCERDMQFIGTPDPVTPTKRPRNDRAGYDNSDAERSASESNGDEKLTSKKKWQRFRVAAQYFPVKRWITGERAEMPEE